MDFWKQLFLLFCIFPFVGYYPDRQIPFPVTWWTSPTTAKSHMFAVAGPQLWQNRCGSFIRCRRRQCFKGMDLRDDVLMDSCCTTSWFFSDGIFEINSFGENLQSSNWGDLCMMRFFYTKIESSHLCVQFNMLFKISLLPRNQEMPQAMETECPPEELVFDNCVSGGLFFLRDQNQGFGIITWKPGRRILKSDEIPGEKAWPFETFHQNSRYRYENGLGNFKPTQTSAKRRIITKGDRDSGKGIWMNCLV